jgi:hypothetical protein
MSQATANQKPSTAKAEAGRPMAVASGAGLGDSNAKKPESDPTWCGLKDDPNFVQCCCNCKHLYPVHYHCSTEPKPTDEQKKAAGIEGHCVCGVQKGWACHNPEMDGRIYDNWPQHSCGCECYDAKSPNEKS